MAKKIKIVLHTDVTDDDGNQFPADLSIDFDELKEKLEKQGYVLTKVE